MMEKKYRVTLYKPLGILSESADSNPTYYVLPPLAYFFPVQPYMAKFRTYVFVLKWGVREAEMSV